MLLARLNFKPQYTSRIPIEYSNRIVKAAYIANLSTIYALYHHQYDTAIIASSIFCTSINYWRNPVKGIRRNIDVTAVQLGLAYNMYNITACDSNFQIAYYSSVALGGMCYCMAKKYGKRLDFDNSTRWHTGVHILANVSNFILIRGMI